MTEEEIRDQSKLVQKNLITKKVKEISFADLVKENSRLEHTQDIVFEELRLSKYLEDNRNYSLSKIIFSVWSRTLDLKTLQPWKYYDNLCVVCEKKSKTIDHFMNCTAYESSALGTSGKQLFENIPDKQFEIAEIMKR